MKECWPGETPISPARREKWRRLFKNRLTRKQSARSETASSELAAEFESDQSSQSTNELQNNVDYFDFSFVE